MRQKVDRGRIRDFLTTLSQRFRRPAKVYLVGGTSLVFEELRSQTIDIDLALEVAPTDHGNLIHAIRDLKNELSVNVEEVSPADFIPLPAGHEDRHENLERFGLIDVLHFDLYSTSLSKIERGRNQDFEDVLALLRAGKIHWDRLSAYFQEILPQMGEHSLRQDPLEFERNFRTLETMYTGDK